MKNKTTFERYMMGKRFQRDGSIREVEEIFVEFTSSGHIERLEIFNDLLDDWVSLTLSINFENTFLKSMIDEFVERELDQIKQEEPDYMTLSKGDDA